MPNKILLVVFLGIPERPGVRGLDLGGQGPVTRTGEGPLSVRPDAAGRFALCSVNREECRSVLGADIVSLPSPALGRAPQRNCRTSRS